jgi:hypothetical protein
MSITFHNEQIRLKGNKGSSILDPNLLQILVGFGIDLYKRQLVVIMQK